MSATKTTKSKKTSTAKVSKAPGKGNTQLEKFFHDSLKDIYWAEKHLTTALPKMQKATTTDELKMRLRNILHKQKNMWTVWNSCLIFLTGSPRRKNVRAWKGLLKREIRSSRKQMKEP